MKPINRITRIAAAASALGVTFALVWSVASLGYPGAAPASVQLAAAQTASHYR